MRLIKTRYALAIWLACALVYGVANNGAVNLLPKKSDVSSEASAPRASTAKPQAAQNAQAAVALEVITKPRNARVRIIDGTDRTYKKGMLLSPGDYRIHVSAGGFPSKTITHKHHAGNSRVTVDLSQSDHQ